MRAIIACAARAKECERRFRALRRPNFQLFGDSETNPLEHIVAYASLCPALGTRLGKRAERALYGKLACRAFTRCWPTPEEHIPSGLDRVRVGLITTAVKGIRQKRLIARRLFRLLAVL